MDSFEDFLRKTINGEGEADLSIMVKKADELRKSLVSFMPKDVDGSTSWDMAAIEYAAWFHLQPYVRDEMDACMTLVLYLKSVVFTAYWLGRRDERLEGMLGGVEMKGGE